jgi:carboxypeptidase Q
LRNCSPQIFVSYNLGQSIKAGASGTFTVDSRTDYIESYNIIAETISGNHDNVITVGSHTDSVLEGPGINDNGSGLITVLRLAEKMAMYSVRNAVRFCFWTAGEVSRSRSLLLYCWIGRLARYQLNRAHLINDYLPHYAGNQSSLLGSTYYMDHLSESELTKIRLNLNFDILASTNSIYGVLDGECVIDWDVNIAKRTFS